MKSFSKMQSVLELERRDGHVRKLNAEHGENINSFSLVMAQIHLKP
jgi:hypothetical protein